MNNDSELYYPIYDPYIKLYTVNSDFSDIINVKYDIDSQTMDLWSNMDLTHYVQLYGTKPGFSYRSREQAQ